MYWILVVLAAFEVAVAGELGDLFSDQALFVEAVAQALGDCPQIK